MDTIVFFGSARLKSRKEALSDLNKFKNVNPKSISDFAQKLKESSASTENV